jgi:hypothetical protein
MPPWTRCFRLSYDWMAPLPGKIAALTLPRTAQAKFESPDSISSSGKKVQS